MSYTSILNLLETAEIDQADNSSEKSINIKVILLLNKPGLTPI